MNNTEKFYKKCEDDFRRIISSFLKLKPQSGGQNGVNYDFLNSLLKNNGSFKNFNTQSQKSTVNNPRTPISPNINTTLLQESNKKIPQKSLSKERILHECQIYDYLQKKSPYFIETSTCFVRCSDDSFFLRNCGITFEELILENLRNVNLFRHILEKLFEKIHFLHLLGVAHNNLDCSHVLVGKRDNINIRSMNNKKSGNLKEEEFFNWPFVRKNIDIRLINFSKATTLQPGQTINADFLNGIFNYYNNYFRTLPLFKNNQSFPT
jgi:hypothetical protein